MFAIERKVCRKVMVKIRGYKLLFVSEGPTVTFRLPLRFSPSSLTLSSMHLLLPKKEKQFGTWVKGYYLHHFQNLSQTALKNFVREKGLFPCVQWQTLPSSPFLPTFSVSKPFFSFLFFLSIYKTQVYKFCLHYFTFLNI